MDNKSKETKSAAEKYFTDGEHFIDLDNSRRYYYGLSSINPEWDMEVRFSVTHNLYKRSEIYFEGDTVKKLIYEEYYSTSGDKGYLESDMDVKTRERKYIIPKTDRGKEKSLTPSALKVPTYMTSQLWVHLGKKCSTISSYNSSNDQQLPLPCVHLDTKEDFARYTEEYIASLPNDYDIQLENFRNKKRVTVKFRAGDIFRVQLTPTLYTYALILAKVREIEKWSEITREHPIVRTMMQPIVYRQYAIVTDNPEMTAEQLADIPLLEMKIGADNDILWETYPIVCSKKLEKSDVDFGFAVDPQSGTVVWGLSMHPFTEQELDGIQALNFHTMLDCATGLTHMTYGVGLGISVNRNNYTMGRIPIVLTEADKCKQKIAEAVGLNPDNAYDEFAEKYGGITRQQFIKLITERC